MYSSFIGQMNNTLSTYLDTQYEGSTMKKVNAPSDDPASAAHILNYRASISETEQFSENVDTALGWLNLSSGVLLEVKDVMNRYVELAQQASTGTMTEENRLQISEEANQLYELLISQANSEFDGRFIYGGQNIDAPPYELGIGAHSEDPELAGMHFTATGEIESSIPIRFTSAGTIPPTTGDITYTYSLDAGETWLTGTVPNNTNIINLGGAQVEIPATATPAIINPYDPTVAATEENGTSLLVRPAAIYKGYDESVPPDVAVYGDLDPTVETVPQGIFTSNVQVRIDSDVDFTAPPPQMVTYSYSEDNGNTWTTKEIATKVPLAPSTADVLLRLPVPGGFFDLESTFTPPATSGIDAGTQFAIQPQRANLDYETSSDSYVMVNDIGKNIFGGLYTPQGTDVEVSAFDGAAENLFETLGKLIGALEINDQQGCAQALEDLKAAQEVVLLAAADAGGRVNRLEATANTLSISILDKTERVSYLEDVDVGQLTIDLSMQKMAYQTVLQSSSMVMNLNLTQFL